MKKKSDKVIIMLCILAVIAVLTWIIPQGSVEYGVYQASDRLRAGIFDIFVEICLSIYYHFTDILFILVIGGCYGVLSKSKMYRKLVDKTANLIKGKEKIAMVVTTLLVSVVTSMLNQLLVMFVFIPFIVTVFLKNKQDRITAFNASFGGILIGFMGITFGMYSMDYLKEATSLEPSFLIALKWIIYFATLVLYNVFAILHMNKTKPVDDTEYDLFATEELEEGKVKKKTKIWPICVLFALAFVILVLGYISWDASFKVSIFSEAFSNFQSAAKIADVPLFSSLLGSQFTAFGNWENLVVASFIPFVVTVIVASVEKMKIGDFILRFEVGMKKVLRMAIIYALVLAVYVMTVGFPWIGTVVNDLFGNGSFNFFTVLIISIIASAFVVQPGYGNYVYGYFLAYRFPTNIAEASLIWHLGQGFVMLLAPTSIILFMALSYLDISYKKWLQYIWKFALSLFVFVVLVFIVKIYM